MTFVTFAGAAGRRHPAHLRLLLRRRARRGVSLFGVLMGLALFAASLIGVVNLYNTSQETQARNEAQQLLALLQVQTQQIFQGASNYGADGDDLVPTLDRRGAIPGSARITGDFDDDNATPDTTQIQHPFGDAVTVVSRAADGFDITFAAMTADNCAALLDPYVGLARGTSGIEEFEIGGTDLDPPLTVADVSDNCDDDANDVRFRFE